MPKFIPTRFHQLLADELQLVYENILNGKDERRVFEIQPQMGKSTLVSELFPAWVLGKTDWPIICSSYGAALAERKSENCRAIVDSDVYKFIFPKVRLSKESTSREFWRTTKGGTYRAVGVGGALTGMSGKILICDDPLKDRADANSEVMREAAWNWWNSVLYTRKQSKSAFLLVNTRWHMQDVAGHLEDQQALAEEKHGKDGAFDKWEKMTFPAIAEDDEYIHGKLFRKAGEVLAPERFSLDDMMRTKNAYMATPGGISEWAALYMQTPIVNENAEFRRSMFKYYTADKLVGKKLYYTTFVDLAISQKKSADHTVVRTVAKEVDGPNWYLMEETAGIMDPLQTIDAIFHHFDLYRSKIYIESVAYQAALQYFVIEEQRKRGIFFTIEEIKPGRVTKKEERIRGLIPLYRAGVIWHRKGEDDALETELLQFPKGRRDDRCFVGDTQVATTKGNVPIKDIKKGDIVLIPGGTATVLDSACTGIKSVITRRGLTGTVDHPVFNRVGEFVNLDALTDNTNLDTLSLKGYLKWTYLKSLSLMGKPMGSWGRENIILSVKRVVAEKNKGLKVYMWPFGNIFPNKVYHQDFMFTISMVTPLIMSLITWSVYRVLNTISFLKTGIWKKLGLIWIKLGRLRLSGINHPKLGIFMSGLLKNLGLEKLNNPLHVYNVGLITSATFLRGPGSVIKIAPKNGEELILRKVYNITTSAGVYYANNILVSNCDALSYGLSVVRHAPRQVEETQDGRLNWKRKPVIPSFNPNQPFNKV